MRGPPATIVTVTPRQKECLEDICRRRRNEFQLHARAKIVLTASEGLSNTAISKKLLAAYATVATWRNRWHAAEDQLLGAEQGPNPDKDLPAVVEQVLSDAYRKGAHAKFTEEQLVDIIAICLEDPADSGNPCSHWSAKEVAAEAVNEGVVLSISTRTVQRLFAAEDFKPQQVKQYTGRVDWNDAEVSAAVHEVCETYKDAQELYEEGTIIASTDEKTGIQAIEPIQPTLPPIPGCVERRGHDYKRHGTLNLTISFAVAVGMILFASITGTRTEVDFVAHIAQTVATAPDSSWVFVLDNLNTHVSEGLVRYVAEQCGITDDLGEKGKSGVLKSMKTRKAFLEDKSHAIRFVYPPTHASWLNQAEIWFSILVRKKLRRGSFKSLEDLEAQLREFIDYFNRVLARPFKWTYAGRPLVAALGGASS